MKRDSDSERNQVSVLDQPILFGSLSFAFLVFALPIYGKALGASALEIGGLFSVFPVAIALLRPIVGWALDKFGRKTFFVAALVCYAGSMGLFAAASDVVWLYLAQLVRGLGSALMWISAYTIATDLATSQERGEAVGHVDEAAARGQLFGGVVGFVLISQLPPDIGWQTVFIGYALMAALGAWLGWKNVPETQPPQTVHAERAGAISRQLFKLMVIVFVTAVSASMVSPLFLIFLQDRFTTDIGTLNVIKLADRFVSHSKSSALHSLFAGVGAPRSNGLNRLDNHLPEALQNW
jgi:MFS family permease